MSLERSGYLREVGRATPEGVTAKGSEGVKVEGERDGKGGGIGRETEWK